MSSELIHLHFGAGRLGLGLIAPWFQKPGSELYLFNRAVSGANPTGSTALEPARRNELLRDHPQKIYYIQKPGEPASEGATVHYDGFFAYDENNLEGIVRDLAAKSASNEAAVVVTASVLKPENYPPVIQALNVLCQMKEENPDALGRIFLVACENTLNAAEVFEHESTAELISSQCRAHVTPVHALVDRMCVGLEEDDSGEHPTVVVRAEDYGSLKLELRPETEPLVEICRGSRVEFSRHVETEKQIKSWQLNGTHWLIALRALNAHQQDGRDFKLNEYLAEHPHNREFAEAVMREMSEGIAILLRQEPTYAEFVRDVNVEDYLDGAAKMILRRFGATDDPITRILARFQAPSPEQHETIVAFSKRFADRVDKPIHAYQSEKGTIPTAASQSIFSLYQLIANGSFIDKVQPAHQAAAQTQ